MIKHNALNKKIIIVFIFWSFLFFFFPLLDISFSSFMLNVPFFVKFGETIRIFNRIIAISGGTILLVVLFIRAFRKIYLKEKNLEFKAFFLLVTLLLGPILIINTVFKDNWGRARPAHITQFGGNSQFTPPFVISDSCQKNCSFPCGDASVGFWLMAFGYITKRKKLWVITGILAGSLIGLGRIAVLGHFLSDVIFSGFFVYFCIEIVWYIFQKFNLIRSYPRCSQP